MQTKSPQITSTLIKYLKELYPVQYPDIHATEREIFFASGRHEVVTHLEGLFKRQSERKYSKEAK